ncbi:phospholipase D-like domain-containing protein [Hyalangium sp.]|uniref:phospholipase D-like domain-containing protein n=1 Tax=Hyalangium sp. TaxID=2028555 RepID=UPI002D6FD114|nr:phospholipase D-like domain-containing protein [Hyalangium sp.]HYI02614.1 phospholipase D-like domain-containing protein [Hyalangium sp.]
MNASEIDDILTATLADRQLTRSERRALQAVLDDRRASEAVLALFRSRAFALARESVTDPRARQVISWLEETVQALLPTRRVPEGSRTETHFSPGDGPLRAIVKLIEEARGSIDVCVFTVTDDRLTRALLDAHRRGVRVRVVSDDDKAHDPGSDIDRLRDAGLPVRLDRTESHMHHKFALFDRMRLLTGSYNWTRSAADVNHENVLISEDPRLVQPFCRAFDDLWAALE